MKRWWCNYQNAAKITFDVLASCHHHSKKSRQRTIRALWRSILILQAICLCHLFYPWWIFSVALHQSIAAAPKGLSNDLWLVAQHFFSCALMVLGFILLVLASSCNSMRRYWHRQSFKMLSGAISAFTWTIMLPLVLNLQAEVVQEFDHGSCALAPRLSSRMVQHPTDWRHR